MSQNGKGDKRRPQLVSNKEMDKNWDRTFSHKKQKDNETKNEGENNEPG